MWNSLIRALRAAAVFLVHLLLAAVVAIGLRAFLILWEWLFGGGEPMVAGLFPMVYILEVGDACILIVFVVFGTLEAVEAFRSK